MMTRDELANWIGALSPQEQADLFDLVAFDGLQEREMMPQEPAQMSDADRQREQYGMFLGSRRYNTGSSAGPSPTDAMTPVAGNKQMPSFRPVVAEELRKMRDPSRKIERATGPLDDTNPNQYSQNYVVGDA